MFCFVLLHPVLSVDGATVEDN